MVAAGMESLRAAQLDALASPTVYRRGTDERQVRAVVGRTVFRTRDACGAWVGEETRDFIVPASELDLEPRRGDEVEFMGGVYEVLAPNGEPVWRWSDPHQTARRIHAKLTGGE